MSRSKGSTGEQLSREMYKSIGPYSTKTLHKNKQDVSYISIGDPYDRSKRDKNPRWSEWCWCFLFVCRSWFPPPGQGGAQAKPLYLYMLYYFPPRHHRACAPLTHISSSTTTIIPQLLRLLPLNSRRHAICHLIAQGRPNSDPSPVPKGHHVWSVRQAARS